MLELVDCIIALVVIIGGLYLYGTWNHSYFKRRNFPCLPSPAPLLGHMWPMAARTLSFGDLIQKFYDQSQGYKFVGCFNFSMTVVMARDPDAIKMITVKDFDYFTDRGDVVSEEVDTLFGKSLIGLGGQRWRDMRATLSPAFTSSKMKGMFGLVSESGEQLADHLEKRCASTVLANSVATENSLCREQGAENLLELDMKDLFTRYTNDVIATAAFGIQVDSLDKPENEFYMTAKLSATFTVKQGLIFLGYQLSPLLMKFLDIPLMPKKVKNFFSSLVMDTMKMREKEGIIRPDLIHLLMEAKKGTLKHEDGDDVDNQSDSQKHDKRSTTELSDEDIIAQAFLFFFAGFETTSTHLSFLTNLLAKHPDVQRRVQEEIDAILDADGGKLTYEGVQKAKYLDMCVSEALRLWPPGVATSRQCVKPYVLPATENTPSINLEKGDAILIPIWGIHRDPQYFPEPDRFDPERFSDENKRSIQPYTYMPFGIGPRNCIGMRFAHMEVKMAMMHLLSRFNLEVSPKTPMEMKMTKSMNMAIEGGFWLGVTPRS